MSVSITDYNRYLKRVYELREWKSRIYQKYCREMMLDITSSPDLPVRIPPEMAVIHNETEQSGDDAEVREMMQKLLKSIEDEAENDVTRDIDESTFLLHLKKLKGHEQLSSWKKISTMIQFIRDREKLGYEYQKLIDSMKERLEK